MCESSKNGGGGRPPAQKNGFDARVGKNAKPLKKALKKLLFLVVLSGNGVVYF